MPSEAGWDCIAVRGTELEGSEKPILSVPAGDCAAMAICWSGKLKKQAIVDLLLYDAAVLLFTA